MDFEYSNPAVDQALRDARSTDDVEAALVLLRQLQFTFADPAIYGRKLFAPTLDQTVSNLARRLRLRDIPLSGATGNPCIVATEFYSVGGHSKVAREIAALLGDQPPAVVLTDVYNRRKHRGLIGEIANPGGWNRSAQLVIGADRLIDKIIELYNLIAALRPRRIFLLSHHMDVVAVAALWPFRDVVEFVHHADHLPALGATLPWGTHADLTYRCHLACQAAGLSPLYVGMEASAPALATAAPAAAGADGTLRIATCASAAKYKGAAAWRWTDFALAALADPRASILHIGPVDDALRAEVGAALEGAGIDPARYEFAGPAPDLAAALRANGVQAYLSSYPVTGGKTNLEVMAAGLVPIVPIDPGTPELLRFDLPIGGWIRIESPSELAGAIEAAQARTPEQAAYDRAQLNAESMRFRRYVSN